MRWRGGADRGVRPFRLVLAGFLAVMLLSACGSGGTEDSSSVAEGAAAGDAAGPGAAPEAADAGGGGGDEAGAVVGEAGGDEAAADSGDADTVALPAAAPSGRRVVTVDLGVLTEDVDAAAAAARGLAAQENGFVADETSTGGDDPSARITLRVPLERTDAVVGALAGLGEEVLRTSTARDVEASLVDLESRVETAQAAIDRIRLLIADTTKLSDVILLEGELSRREADLEALDAQRAALAGQAALATITVSLSETSDAGAIVAGKGNPFTDGLSAGWRALTGSTSILLIVVGALLPFLVVGAVVAAVVGLVVRATRRGRRRAGEPTRPGDAAPVADSST